MPPRAPGPDVAGFPACAAIVRRDAFLAVGGFSRLLFFGGEETLVGLDLLPAGWDVCYLPAIRAHHAPSPLRGEHTVRWRRHARNDLLVAWLRRALPVALAESARLAGRALRDPQSALAALGVLRRAPALAAQRRRCTPVAERRLVLTSR